MMILSGDPPRSRVLSLLLIVIVTLLALAPFLFPGAKAMNVASKICIFAALVASYDLLLGYTGTVSFAHTMFYGIGSYAIAIALYAMGPTWAGVATGIIIGLPLAALLALGIGLFSLRVQAIFFAMITLAVASAFLVLASQMSWLTGGDDSVIERSCAEAALLADLPLVSKIEAGVGGEHRYFQAHAGVGRQVAAQSIIYEVGQFLGGKGGQESQASEVHAQQGDLLPAQPAGDGKQRAVSSQYNDQLCVRVRQVTFAIRDHHGTVTFTG